MIALRTVVIADDHSMVRAPLFVLHLSMACVRDRQTLSLIAQGGINAAVGGRPNDSTETVVKHRMTRPHDRSETNDE